MSCKNTIDLSLIDNIRPHVLITMLQGNGYFNKKEVTIVGDIARVDTRKRFIAYDVDDGSGRITCKQWKKKNFITAPLGALVQITGQAQLLYSGKIEILIVQMIDKTNFPMVEILHWTLSLEYHQEILIPCRKKRAQSAKDQFNPSKPPAYPYLDLTSAKQQKTTTCLYYNIAKNIKSYLQNSHQHTFTAQNLLHDSQFQQNLFLEFPSSNTNNISNLLMESIKQMYFNGWIYCQNKFENSLKCCYQLIDNTNLYRQLNEIVDDLCQYRECVHLKDIYRNLILVDQYHWVAKSTVVKFLQLLVGDKELICIQGSYFTPSPTNNCNSKIQ
ncbi:hypothetical protein TrispH2_002451 [Trichoplax sp. H2]|nr:hypothetical protein TrispH2_002451 [Trichoplax sp. H2]|eukprot:RDD44897.1 hypothetical protein TrispH2_002451 [Trichoplax sp. H2]